MSEQFLRIALAALNAADESQSASVAQNAMSLHRPPAPSSDERVPSSPERLANNILLIVGKLCVA